MQTQPLTTDIVQGHLLLARAVEIACTYHTAQVRKGTQVPYVSHLLQVAGLVLEFGGTFEQAAAGVLHDALEDTDLTPELMRELLGGDRRGVVDLVIACTDTDENDVSAGVGTRADDGSKIKAPWRTRKERHLKKLADVSEDAALVIACDKLHNLRTQLTDLAHNGGTVKFNASYEDRRWLANAMLDVLRPKIGPHSPILSVLASATREWEDMHELVRIVEPEFGE